MGQLFLIALRNLLQHRRRTVLLGGALAGVTALLIILTGLTTGVRETMINSATTLMTGHVNVAGFYKPTSGQSAPVVTEYHKVLEDVKRVVPEIDYVAERGRGWGKLIGDGGSIQVGMAGIDITREPGFPKVVQLVAGDLKGLEKPGTILIFEDQAKRLEASVGDTLTLSTSTTRGIANTADVLVVAIARNIGFLSMWNVYIPAPTLRNLYQINEDTTGALQVYIKDTSKTREIAERLRVELAKSDYRVMDANSQPFWMKFEPVNREDWTGQKLDVTTWEDELAFMTWTLSALDGLTAMLISILMVIIVVGIMNTMWIAVRERTREIGTLRAIGMQRGRVMAMFLIEAGLLGVLGTVGGVLIGILTSLLLNSAGIPVPLAARIFLLSETLWFSIGTFWPITAVILISVVTTLAAIWPAWRAARLKPVTAMHHIG